MNFQRDSSKSTLEQDWAILAGELFPRLSSLCFWEKLSLAQLKSFTEVCVGHHSSDHWYLPTLLFERWALKPKGSTCSCYTNTQGEKKSTSTGGTAHTNHRHCSLDKLQKRLEEHIYKPERVLTKVAQDLTIFGRGLHWASSDTWSNKHPILFHIQYLIFISL